MEPTFPPDKQSQPKVITITSPHFAFSNIEAWINIMRSYEAKHPTHSVHLVYEGKEIQNRLALFRVERPVNKEGFECYVTARDENMIDVPKLYRLLYEGAGPNFMQFINREVHTILKLF